MNRREFLRTAGGAAGGSAVVAGAAGPAAAAENGGNQTDGGGGGGATAPPDYGGWLEQTDNFDGTTVDATGQESVTISVGASGNGGNFAFAPPAIHVDAGATVVWEWTGEGGQHNVVTQEAPTSIESDLLSEAGATFEQTLEQDGIYKYYCNPHKANGMVGAVVVGTDYATAPGPGVATPMNPEHMGVPFQAHFVGLATIVMIVVSLIFVFFQLKYGESPNTKGGND